MMNWGLLVMIRKCVPADHENLIRSLKMEPAINLIIIADIENYGYLSDNQDIWGDFDRDMVHAVLLRHDSSFFLYARADHDLNGFISILSNHETSWSLLGKLETIEPYASQIPFTTIRKQYLSQLQPDLFHPLITEGNSVERARLEHAIALYELHRQIREFRDFPRTVEAIQRELRDATRRTFIVKKGDTVLASAQTLAETSISAMIGGVMTHPGYRNRGLASTCVSILCRQLLDENKTPCLFYDNPSAGRMYKALGFVDIDQWMTCIR